MGSGGAGRFVAAVAISLSKSLCIALGNVDIGGVSIEFPKLTAVAQFVLMAVVLTIKPQGLFGRAPDLAPPASTERHGSEAPIDAPR